MIARRAAVIAFAALAIAAPPVSAGEDPETPSTAIGATVGFAALATMMCWTAQIVASRSDRAAAKDSDSKDGDSEDPGFDRRGFVIGLNGTYAIEAFRENEEADLQDALQPFTTSLTMGNTGGLSGFVGYRCNRHFSAELQVEWLHGFEGVQSEEMQGEFATATLEPIFTSVNGKGYLLTGRYQPYVLVGAGTLTVDTETREILDPTNSNSLTKTMIAMRFGGGVDVYATKHIVVNLGVDYVLPVTGVKNLEYISINAGLRYRF